MVRTKTARVKELLVGLCDLYASSSSVPASSKSKSSSGSTIGSSSNLETGQIAEMLEDWEKELEDTCEIVVESEVDRYLLDSIEKPPKGSNFDLLLWWRLNGSKYPNLQAVAKDVLAIQVSTVASESSFSTGKRAIDPFRSSLTPRTVEALICLQNWIRSEGHGSIEYYPTVEEIKFYEGMEAEVLEKATNETAGSSKSPSSKSKKPAKVSRSAAAATHSNPRGK